jgi:hypothetical protein
MSVVERAYSNHWIISEMGLETRSKEKRDDWFDIKHRVRLA